MKLVQRNLNMLATNPWKQEDGDAFAKHFAKRLSATTNPVVEIFNYGPGVRYPRPEDGHVMKVKFQVRRRKIDMEISIVFNRGCEFNAEVAAYVRPLSYGDDGGWVGNAGLSMQIRGGYQRFLRE